MKPQDEGNEWPIVFITALSDKYFDSILQMKWMLTEVKQPKPLIKWQWQWQCQDHGRRVPQLLQQHYYTSEMVASLRDLSKQGYESF